MTGEFLAQKASNAETVPFDDAIMGIMTTTGAWSPVTSLGTWFPVIELSQSIEQTVE